jgi:hypothetical protein
MSALFVVVVAQLSSLLSTEAATVGVLLGDAPVLSDAVLLCERVADTLPLLDVDGMPTVGLELCERDAVALALWPAGTGDGVGLWLAGANSTYGSVGMALAGGHVRVFHALGLKQPRASPSILPRDMAFPESLATAWSQRTLNVDCELQKRHILSTQARCFAVRLLLSTKSGSA